MTGSASPSYFNPRSPYGERPWPWASRPPRTDFNPRSPYGERRYSRWADPQPGTFQSTLPIRGATLRSAAIDRYVSTISIHAPHTGSDVPHSFSSTTNADFNPRSPYGERHDYTAVWDATNNFNPRSPYGERRRAGGTPRAPSHFNPRSPYGERLVKCLVPDGPQEISIHAPHTGSDSAVALSASEPAIFQSTLPIRGATPSPLYRWPGCEFQSTLPIRGATLFIRDYDAVGLFQSTLPIRGATLVGRW